MLPSSVRSQPDPDILCVPACPAGWFSLNVPSGLTLYWFINNIISTAMQLYMRNTIKVDVPALASDGAAPIIDVSSTVIKPKEDRSKQVGGRGRDTHWTLYFTVLAACDFVRVWRGVSCGGWEFLGCMQHNRGEKARSSISRRTAASRLAARSRADTVV